MTPGLTVDSRSTENVAAMHVSISTFSGDPDDLLASYDALLAEFGVANLHMHMCLRSPQGIVVVDTCPTREDYEAFHHSEAFRSALARHGLSEPTAEDYPVHVAVVEGREVREGVPS